MSRAPLSCEDLCVGIGGHALVDDVCCALSPGSVCAILGRNGAGKSTLLRCLAGLTLPRSGRARVGGEDIHAMPLGARARALAWLGQGAEFSSDLTVEEIVQLGRIPWAPRSGSDPRHRGADVDAAIERMHLAPLRARRMSTLSGGERQRALLARTLATRAPILLLDEPTTGLDIAAAIEVIEHCRDLARSGHTLVVVLHDFEQARAVADHMILLGAHPELPRTALAGPTDDVMTPERLTRAFATPIGARVSLGSLAL